MDTDSDEMTKDAILPPTDIPDLSALQLQTEWAFINRAILGGGSSDFTAYTLQLNCVRLMDAAIRDYSLGRQAILSFHARSPDEFGLGWIAMATTHFESCVWHLERAVKHARVLRSLKTAETGLKQLISKKLSFFSASAESRITALRDTLAHLEKAAGNGELRSGESIALMPTSVGLSISGHTIEWAELAGWLTDGHSCVAALASFKPSRDSG
ncbi:MAG: hypothetical protein IPH76_15235 [Xanthomonadales bacterium]|nr:hypothetical protein [Xanthomonadales bacterium]